MLKKSGTLLKSVTVNTENEKKQENKKKKSAKIKNDREIIII